MANSDNLVCFFQIMRTLSSRLDTGLLYEIGRSVGRKPEGRPFIQTTSGSYTIYSTKKFQKESQQLLNWISTTEKTLSISSFPKPITCNLSLLIGDTGQINIVSSGPDGNNWVKAATKLMTKFQSYMQQAGINPSLSQSEFNSLVAIMKEITQALNRRGPGGPASRQ